MSSDSTPSRRRISWPPLILMMVFLLNGVQSSRLFPTWGSLIDDQPVLTVDHAIHLYHGALGSQFLREHQTTWGYDPFFMSGYPETPIWDSSSNLSIAFELAGGGGYNPRAYKLGLFLFTLLTIPMLAFGAKAAGLSTGETALISALGFVVFWSCVSAVFWRTGLFAFVTASAMLCPILGLLVRFDRRPTPRRWFGLLAGGTFFLFAHVTAPVLLIGGAAGYGIAVLSRWRARRERLAAVLVAALLAMMLNAVWLVPLWRFRSIRDAGLYFLTPSYPSMFITFLWKNPLDGRITLSLLVPGTLGLLAWWVEGQRLRAVIYAGTLLVFLSICTLGGLWTITKTLEPMRFLSSLQLLLTVPAGSFLTRLLSKLARNAGGGRRGGGVVMVAGGVVLACVWLITPLTLPYAFEMIAKRRPLVIGLRLEDRQLVDWLRSNTDLTARVLFEDQLRLFEQTDPESTHWTPLLPILLRPEGRAFVGGVYLTAFISHNRRANYGDYTLGGRRIDLWMEAELSEFYREYNVGWAVAWSPLSRFVLDRSPRAKRVGTVPRAVSPSHRVMRDETQWRAIADKAGADLANQYLNEGVASYALYRLDRPHSFFLEGKGRLIALGPNRVELADVLPDPYAGSAVLSLHWLDTWRSDPPLRLSPAFAVGDPVPFVRIQLDKPLDRIVITNRY